ncbi:MAG: DUF5777 family beta-barrel protein [Phycisphaerae bacterium]|nr:DUF5777 family beta-barrel protein [Phycisphaerae bacterium]
MINIFAIILSLGFLLIESPVMAQEAEGAASGSAKSVPAEETEEIEELGDVSEVSEEEKWFSDAYTRVEHFGNLKSAETVRKNSLVLDIDHRSIMPTTEDPLHSAFSLDSGMKIGLGLRYGILDYLDAGIFRLNNGLMQFDTYEFDLRLKVLNSADHWLDLAVRPGYSIYVQKNAQDASGFFGQLIASKLFINRLMVGCGALFHSDSSENEKTVDDTDYSVAAQVAFDFRIASFISVFAEVTPAFLGYHAKYPVVSFGPKFITNRHTYSIIISNSQNIGADGVVANTSVKPKDFIWGFQIIREFDL